MLKGNLADFPLVGVLQMLRSAGRTGTLHIRHKSGDSIVVTEGRVVHAAAHPSQGPRALTVLAGIATAAFEFDNATSDERTIEGSPDALLTGLAQDTLAWQAWREKLDWKAVPRWVDVPGPMDFEHVQVSSVIDGRRDIETIIRTVGIPPHRVAEIILEFYEARLLRFGTHVTSVLEPVELIAQPILSLSERSVYIDEALHAAWAVSLGDVRATLSVPGGSRSSFQVQPRSGITGQVLVPRGALRRMDVSRGARVRVTPER